VDEPPADLEGDVEEFVYALKERGLILLARPTTRAGGRACRAGGRRLARRVRRHLRWARAGRHRLIEGGSLNPLERIHSPPPSGAGVVRIGWRPRAVPVFVVGLQRSGTNMLVRSLEPLAEFEVPTRTTTRPSSGSSGPTP
jgi:hypothetical protein